MGNIILGICKQSESKDHNLNARRCWNYGVQWEKEGNLQ